MCLSTHSIHANMGFTNEHFPIGTHICLIFEDEKERKDIISKFVSRGLADGEKVAYFADTLKPDMVIKWLNGNGIDLTHISNPNALLIAEAMQIYCPNGKFVPEEMLNTLKQFYLTTIEEKFIALRGSGEMSWALKGIPGSEKLMEYECKINNLVLDYPINMICQYNVNLFDSATILECLKVHPYLIVKGQILRNPYYLKPEEYLSN